MWADPGVKAVGVCDYARRRILVDPTDGFPFWTLFHELCHATLPDNDENSVEWMEIVAQKLTGRYPKLKI